MMHSLNADSRSLRLIEAVQQARQGAFDAVTPAFIHELPGDKFLVNAQREHEHEPAIMYVRPEGTLLYNIPGEGVYQQAIIDV